MTTAAQIASLHKIARVQELIRQGETSVRELVARHDVKLSTMRKYLVELELMGKITRITHLKSSGGHVDTFVLSADKTPILTTGDVKRAGRGNKTKVQADARFVRLVPAVQMGMVRDPLVAALYGAMGRVA